LKTFDENYFKEDVSRIPFHVSEIFNDVSDQYWVQTQLFTDVLNDHAPLKERAVKENHVPYMNSSLRKQMYKRNMLKNIHQENRSDAKNRELYRIERNKTTHMRREAIKNHFMSRCKPGANSKDFFDAIGPFMLHKSKTHRDIILMHDEHIVTDTKEQCELFANLFSTIASSIGSPDEIDMSQSDFLARTLEKHSNHDSVKAIKARHSNGLSFDFKPVERDYVQGILSRLKIHKATGYDNIPPKMIKICSDELATTLTELVNSAFKSKRFPEDNYVKV
jgi:hypothetical protein